MDNDLSVYPKLIRQSLQKNASDFSLNLIKQLLKKNPNVERWLSKPIYLRMLVESTEKLQSSKNPQAEFDKLTETTASLMEGFIQGLFACEKKKDSRFSETAFEYFLIHIANFILNEAEGYTLPRLKLISVLKEPHQLFSDTDLDYFLTTCKNLGLLVESKIEEEELYSFAHEEYLSFFASKALDL